MLLPVGLAVAAAALLLNGPSPWLPDPPVPQHSLPLFAASMAAFGVGAGLTVPPPSLNRAAVAPGTRPASGPVLSRVLLAVARSPR